MGGDFAPLEAIKGASIAKQKFPDCEIVLIGNKEQSAQAFKDAGVSISDFKFVHSEEVIGMSEHATKALTQKKNSSISVGFHLLKEKQIDAFCSAGNTGAMMVGAMFSVKAIEGILRPTITSVLPKVSGGFGLLMDVGANADCKPEMLHQFAILGSLYCKFMYGIENPKVGLLSIGEEKEKGDLLRQATYGIMEASKQYNFVGNVEGRDLFLDKADAVVTDGFTGNVVLKACESMYYILRKKGIGTDDEFLDKFNFENYGGSAILGVNAPVIIGHGISKANTFVNMIKLSRDIVESGLIDKFKKSFAKEITV